MPFRDSSARSSDYFLNVTQQEGLLGRRDVSDVGAGRELARKFEILICELPQVHLRPEKSPLEMQTRGFRQFFEADLEHLDAQILEAFIQTSLGDQEI